MNWGYKILLVYAVFVIGIMTLVFVSSNQKMDLVTPDYYGKELKFQQQIDESKRAGALSQEVRCEVKERVLIINLPAEFEGKKIEGELSIYCPSDMNKDKQFTIETAETTINKNLPDGLKGMFEVHLKWKADGITYYFEKKLIL